MRFQTLFEGRYIFAVIFVLLAVGLYMHWRWLTVLATLLVLFCINFFRDPNRNIPPGENVVVAAADGHIAEIAEVEETEVLKTKCRRVGIFLSVCLLPLSGKNNYR